MKHINIFKKFDNRNVKKYLQSNKVIIIKKFYSKKLCRLTVSHLKAIALGSMTSYYPIKIGSPNFHRVNYNDPRSYVKGFFHQFNFFPWNQDQLDLFNLYKDAFVLKNQLNNLEDKRFFEPISNSDCTIRLSFQFYPSAKGFMDLHSDPVDYHQNYLFMLSLSTKGKDYSDGGLFVRLDNKIIFLDDYASSGDLIIFKANIPHGVKNIDEKKIYKPLSFNGRWMVIFSTNKLINNKIIKNSIKV